MNRRVINIRKNKCGFTLLETLLSVALLLILTLIIYQGFMTTLKISANTANYQKSANNANSSANLALANNPGVAPFVSTISFNPPSGIGVSTEVFDVNIYKAVPASPVILDAEDNSGLVTANRYSFRYISPVPVPT